MTVRKFVLTIGLAFAGLLVLAVGYVMVADLSRHKPRIEEIVGNKLGRDFAIDGEFELDIYPAIRIVAGDVRIANAEWAAAPDMLEVARFAVEIDLWSTLFGPVDIRSLELEEVAIRVEANTDGTSNWALGDPGAADEAVRTDGVTELPFVIRHAGIRDLDLRIVAPGVADRRVTLEAFTVEPDAQGLLAITGHGAVDRDAFRVEGSIGPLTGLLAGEDIRLDVGGSLRDLSVKAHGSIGRLHPLDGLELELQVRSPSSDRLLERFGLPVAFTGALVVDGRTEDAGDGTNVRLHATVGENTLDLNGTLEQLALDGTRLRFSASVPEIARAASLLGVDGLPDDTLAFSGTFAGGDERLQLTGIRAGFAGATLTGDADVGLGRGAVLDAGIAFDADDLARIFPSLPPLAVHGQAQVDIDGARFALADADVTIGGTRVTGDLAIEGRDRRRIAGRIAAPLIDLTPLLGKGDAAAPDVAEIQRARIFSDEPIQWATIEDFDVDVAFEVDELVIDNGRFTGVNGDVRVNAGDIELDVRADGGIEGTLDLGIRLRPEADGAASLDVRADIDALRSGLQSGDGVPPAEVPPLSVSAQVSSTGDSPHQLAARANGRILLSQGEGKARSGALALFAGDTLTELAARLNPFAEKDPYTVIDCVVVRADIRDGHVEADPVLLQGSKITVTAQGTIDLETETLLFDFNTRPRKGLGISPGMITNPFVRLQGTLSSPAIGVGKKGFAMGALAAATGGASVLAEGLLDRARGEADLCADTLELARR